MRMRWRRCACTATTCSPRAVAAAHGSYDINGWHRDCTGLYDLCMEPRILDPVQDLLGRDLGLRGTHFFLKEPDDTKRVRLAPGRVLLAAVAEQDRHRVAADRRRRRRQRRHGGHPALARQRPVRLPAQHGSGDQRAHAPPRRRTTAVHAAKRACHDCPRSSAESPRSSPPRNGQLLVHPRINRRRTFPNSPPTALPPASPRFKRRLRT